MKLSLSWKFPLTFVALTAVSSILVGVLATSRMSSTMETIAEDSLAASSYVIAAAIENTLSNYEKTLHLLADDESILEAIDEFSRTTMNMAGDPLRNVRNAFVSQNPYTGGHRMELTTSDSVPHYSDVHSTWHRWFTVIAGEQGLDDIYLLNPQGEVIYSVAKRDDFGLSVHDEALQSTGLSEVAIRTLQTDYADAHKGFSFDSTPIFVSDLSPYKFTIDSGNGIDNTSFIAAPVLNSQNVLAGIVAFAIPETSIQVAMAQENGLRVPVEIQMLSTSGDLTTSSGYIVDRNGTVVTQSSNAPNAQSAIAGETGVVVFDADDGTKLMSSYAPVYFGEQSYGLTATVSYAMLLADATSMKWSIFMLVLGIVATTSIASAYFGRAIVRPIIWVSKRMNRMADEKDLTKRMSVIQRNDEMGDSARAFDRLIQFFDQTLLTVRSRTNTLQKSANDLEMAAQSLANNAETQSSSVDELSASVEQTAAQVKTNADAAKSTDLLVQETTGVITNAREKVGHMVSAMDAINDSSQSIAKIIKVIDEIAFQTNLLALNAAVEAARAGQHGRGFAVVAQEVRNLAGRSAKAAQETSELIEGSRSRVREGVEISEQTSKAFDEISDNISEVSTLVTEISVASVEQARGVEQVRDAIGEIARITRATSKQAEAFASSATEVALTNEELRSEIANFQLSENTIDHKHAVIDVTPVETEPSKREKRAKVREVAAQMKADIKEAANSDKAPKAPKKHAEKPAFKNPDTDERGFGSF